MDDEQARVLAREGNIAIVHLGGRAFPGICIQGDTFAELLRRLANAATELHDTRDDIAAFDGLDGSVAEMTQMLRVYESVLAERGIRYPYVTDGAD